MRLRYLMLVLCLLLCAGLFPGCGGGGASKGHSTPVAFTVNWATRSRAEILAPASALSVVLTVPKALANGDDLLVTRNRHADPAAYTETYSSTPLLALPGSYAVTLRFYAQLDGAGALVGEAHAAGVTFAADGSGIGTVATAGTVATVTVDGGQTLAVSEHKQLQFSARDQTSALLALSPGSAQWTLITGSAVQLTADGIATGLTSGSAQVAATVDGIAATPVDVVVNAPPTLPGGAAIDTVQTTTVSAASGETITDSLTGLTFGFPSGGAGILTTATVTNPPGNPLTGGTGFAVTFTGDTPVTVTKTAVGDAVPYLLVYGILAACAGGTDDSNAPRWIVVAPTVVDNQYTFTLPNLPTVASSSSRKSRSIRKSRDNAGGSATLAWTGDVTITNRIQKTSEVRTQITTCLTLFPEPLQTSIRTRVTENPAAIGFIPGEGMLGQNDSSYQPFCMSITGRVVQPVLTYIEPTGATAHEVGHYLSHMAMTDDQFAAIMATCPASGHFVGQVHTNRCIGEDYAYVIQTIAGYNYQGLGDLTDIRSFLKPRAAEASLVLDPTKIDMPGMEGFASQLLGYLSNTSTSVYDFSGTMSPVPAVGASTSEILNTLFSSHASTVNELRSAMDDLASMKAKPNALAVIAERVGWSYHGKGHLKYPNGDPGANLKVKGMYTVGGVDYFTPEVTSDAQGQFALSRMFPGPYSKIRITDDGVEYDKTIGVDWNAPTNVELDLGEIVIQENPRLTWLKTAHLLGGGIVGTTYQPWVYCPFNGIPFDTITITWNKRNFTLTSSNTYDYSSTYHHTVNCTATGQLSADATTLLVMDLTSTYKREGVGDLGQPISNTETWHFHVSNVPLQGMSSPDGLNTSAAYQGGTVEAAHISYVDAIDAKYSYESDSNTDTSVPWVTFVYLSLTPPVPLSSASIRSVTATSPLSRWLHWR